MLHLCCRTCCTILQQLPLAACESGQGKLRCLFKGSRTNRAMHPREQTIFALSSGRPPSAISIVRVSGPHARAALTSLAGRAPVPRMATRVLLLDASQQPIDDAV